MHYFLHYAIPGTMHEAGNDANDLVKDWGVVEEFRVGALEIVSSFGESLLWRPSHFLQGGIGQPLGEAMRRALLAARGQISVYPRVVEPLWTEAADALGRDIIVTDENWFDLSFGLKDHVAERLDSVFSDPEISAAAGRLRGGRRTRGQLTLRPDWPRYVFWDREMLIADPPAPPAKNTPKKFTVTTHSDHERAYVKTVLGLPDWPFRFGTGDTEPESDR